MFKSKTGGVRMNELEDKIIIGKGCKQDLIKDLESIVRVDDLLMETYNSIYGTIGDNLGNSVMSKYDINQKELRCNFILYQSYRLRQ